MNKIFVTIALQIIALAAFGQAGVGVGVTSPDPSAVLHIQPPTNNKGLLIPRLTTDERNNIVPAAEGLLVYDTSLGELYYYSTYLGVGSWEPVGMPRGSIIMWSGTTLPKGWALCDGVNGPDLRERFIVGAGGDNTLVGPTTGYSIGQVGGQNEVTLTVAQMPSHTHVINPAGSHSHGYRAPLTPGGHPGGDGGYSRPNGVEDGTTETEPDHNHTMQPQGSGQAHENRPPYYALAFIIKL